MTKIQVWGDSILKGIIYDEKAGKYVILKHNAISDVLEKTKIKIENYSKFGQTILRAEPRLQKHLQDVELPDMIILELGGNDCDLNWKEVGDAPDAVHQAKTPLSVYKAKLIEIIQTIKNKGINPVIASLPPLDYKRYFKWITRSDDVSEEGVLQYLKSPYEIYTWHEGYDRCAKEVAKIFDVPVIDVREEFLKNGDYSVLMCEDGIHPNREGQHLIGDVLTNFITQRLLS